MQAGGRRPVGASSCTRYVSISVSVAGYTMRGEAVELIVPDGRAPMAVFAFVALVREAFFAAHVDVGVLDSAYLARILYEHRAAGHEGDREDAGRLVCAVVLFHI